MGKNADRNQLCRCGSGKKIKKCKCKLSMLDRVFPKGRLMKKYFNPPSEMGRME